jgi:hypothetical protein
LRHHQQSVRYCLNTEPFEVDGLTPHAVATDGRRPAYLLGLQLYRLASDQLSQPNPRRSATVPAVAEVLVVLQTGRAMTFSEKNGHYS